MNVRFLLRTTPSERLKEKRGKKSLFYFILFLYVVIAVSLSEELKSHGQIIVIDFVVHRIRLEMDVRQIVRTSCYPISNLS